MHTEAPCSSAARWLVILMTAILLAGLGAVPAKFAPEEQTCRACVRCTCCVQQAPTRPTAPLAPAAASQPVMQKVFSLPLTLSVRPLLAGLSSDVSSFSLPFVSWPAAAPLYQRHCTYLI